MQAFQAGKRHYFHGLYRSTHRKPITDVPAHIPIHNDTAKLVGDFLGKDYKMPSKGKTRPRPRRSRRRARRRYGVARYLNPFSLTRKFKTVAYTTLDAGAGSLASSLIKLNSHNDPTGAIGVGQPLGYDQYATLYNKAFVVGWQVKLEMCSTDNTNPIVVGFTPTTYSTALTSFSHYKEVPHTVSLVLTPDIDKARLFARGSVKKFIVPRGGRLLAYDEAGSFINADPVKLLFGHIWAQAMDGSANPASVHVVVTIYQTVVFTDPTIPSRS